MKKIPTLFLRDFDGDPRLVTREVHPDCRWAFDGYGVASRKWDGTAVLIDPEGLLWKRYDAKGGKTPPFNFRPAMEPDPKTGHWAGWVPVGCGPEDKWHNEAANARTDLLHGRTDLLHGRTYELIGPKIGGNPEGEPAHVLVMHGEQIFADAPHTFDGLSRWLETQAIEGIVFTFGSLMCKIKRSDFGLPWPL